MLSNIESLVGELIDAAYDSGYYSGKGEDGQPRHMAAIERREKLRGELLRRLSSPVPSQPDCAGDAGASGGR